MYEHIDLSHIPVFLAVAECMSFTEAAYRLYSTQSSVSKTIAKFEASLGYPLFIRQNRKISLTKEGAFLFTRLSNAMTDITGILTEARIIHEGGSGKLAIGTSGYTPRAEEFEKVCSLFTMQYASYEIELRYMQYAALKRTIADKKIDAILLNDEDVGMLEGYSMLPLFAGETLLIRNPFDEIKKPAGELSLADFADRRFICIDREIIPPYYNYLTAACKAYGFMPNITRYVPSLHEVIHYIGSSDLVTVLDRAFFPTYNTNLKILPVPYKEGMVKPLRSVFVWNPDNENPALLEFIKLTEETLQVEQETI